MNKSNILNIVQKSLSTLIIDDNDSSVAYKHSDIDNTYIHLSLSDLTEIFKHNKKELFNQDTRYCLTFILKNNSEISLHEYMPSLKDQLEFLKITTPEIEDGNEILVALTQSHRIPYRFVPWTTHDYDEIKKHTPDYSKYKGTDKFKCACQDFDGYKNSQLLKNYAYMVNDIYDYPAAGYCMRQIIDLGGIKYHGYLPAAGQLEILYQNRKMINYIMNYIGQEEILGIYWSSSERDFNNVWCRSVNCKSCGKKEEREVLPLFKKMN